MLHPEPALVIPGVTNTLRRIEPTDLPPKSKAQVHAFPDDKPKPHAFPGDF